MQQQLRAPGWHIGRTRGKPFTAFGMQVVPIGFAVHVSWPGGGFTWHRPVAVEVRQEDTIYRLPIYDSTSRVISAIVLTGLATVLVPFVIRTIFFRRRRTT